MADSEALINKAQHGDIKAFHQLCPDFEEPLGGRKEEGEDFISRHFASEERARAWLIEA
jgi:hypothetical protein